MFPFGVLIIGHSRPKNLAKLIEQSLQLGFRVYVSIDGSRNVLCAEANNNCKDLVEKYRNKLHRSSIEEKNLGLRAHVLKAITWAFETEENLVILEEDLEVGDSTILYLGKTVVDLAPLGNVGVSCGTRLIDPVNEDKAISFVRNFQPWGWSISRSTWLDFTEYLTGQTSMANFWLSFNLIRTGRPFHWVRTFRYARDGRLDSWATLFQEYLLIKNLLVALPPQNLVRNVGWDFMATHTLGSPPKWVPDSIAEIKSYVIAQAGFEKSYMMDKQESLMRREESFLGYLRNKVNIWG